jgi:geranylgeranyl diphosphate synthase, type II
LATAAPKSTHIDAVQANLAGSPPLRRTSGLPANDYADLMSAAAQMFDRPVLDRLAPRLRGGQTLAEVNGQGVQGLDPLAATEAIAYDFLAKGGKHSRPFITLAVYDALAANRLLTRAAPNSEPRPAPQSEPRPSGSGAFPTDTAHDSNRLPESVQRCALSIETFHKASLVHDDIQDDDEFRYGDQTLHRKFGTATAINVGDYLIGLGYRLICREAKSIGPEVVGDILDRLADAHMKLSEGQGAELIWRDSRNKRLSPQDALKIYALKTAPAFEAALHTGVRLAGPADKYLDPISQFARNLGIAFQIINDLNDWLGDDHNKLSAAGDVIGGRPTVLWALALDGLQPALRSELESLASRQPLMEKDLQQIRRFYDEAGAFEKAARLVEKHQQRAEAVANEIEPEALRRLFYYLIDMVLQRRHDPAKSGRWTASGPAA